MFRRSTLALALALLAAYALPAGATFLRDPFLALQEELEQRRDNDYGGTLDRVAKKEAKAVGKALAALAKPADDVLDDVKTATSTRTALAKAFKAEFKAATDPTPVKVQQLPALYAGAFSKLAQALGDNHLDIEAALGSLDEKAAAKVRKQSDKLQAALTADGLLEPIDFKGRGKQLTKAASAAVKAQKLITKFGGGTPTGGGTNASVDGSPWVSSAAQSEYYSGDKTLQIYATRTLQDGTREAIYLLVRGVNGPGPQIALDANRARGNFQVIPPGGGAAVVYDLVPNSGFLNVEVLDLALPHVRATFAFQAMHATEGMKSITDGTHDITSDVYLFDTNGF